MVLKSENSTVSLSMGFHMRRFPIAGKHVKLTVYFLGHFSAFSLPFTARYGTDTSLYGGGAESCSSS